MPAASDAVYAWGHQDDTGIESYIKLDASPLDSIVSARIELSAKHFIPIWSGGVAGKCQASLHVTDQHFIFCAVVHV